VFTLEVGTVRKLGLARVAFEVLERHRPRPGSGQRLPEPGTTSKRSRSEIAGAIRTWWREDVELPDIDPFWVR